MMSNTLRMNVRDTDGALVRVLGLTERRGYRPTSVVAESGGSEPWFQLRLRVETRRPIEQLVRQLNKLIDVRDVEVRDESQ
jgi:acetolactate synthase II small subunit